MEKPPDRRVRRTREALYAAVVTLILDKGYGDISVADILETADVGRSTFYGHFTGKEDLLRFGFARLRARLEQTEEAALYPEPPASFAFSLPLLRHAAAHRQLFRAMVGDRGGLVAEREFRAIVVDRVRRDLSALHLDPTLDRELLVEMLAGAFLSLLRHWLDRRHEADATEIDAAFRQLALAAIAAPTPADPSPGPVGRLSRI